MLTKFVDPQLLPPQQIPERGQKHTSDHPEIRCHTIQQYLFFFGQKKQKQKLLPPSQLMTLPINKMMTLLIHQLNNYLNLPTMSKKLLMLTWSSISHTTGEPCQLFKNGRYCPALLLMSRLENLITLLKDSLIKWRIRITVIVLRKLQILSYSEVFWFSERWYVACPVSNLSTSEQVGQGWPAPRWMSGLSITGLCFGLCQ